MSYPVEILPTLNHKWIECSISDHFLIRYFEWEEGEEMYIPGTQNINVHYICSPEQRIDDLSMSLLDIYNERHISLTLTEHGKEVYNHYCGPDEDVPVPVLDRDFTNHAVRGFWCAPVNRLADIPFAYTIGEDPFTATCRVVHTPMRWNYWHHSLRWITDIGPIEAIEDEKKRKKIARRIGHSARVAISHFAVHGVPEVTMLPKTCYCKN
jgi:hypothetical protein